MPTEYPFRHPAVVFQGTMFHPNVDDEGKICNDILGAEWSPQTKIEDVLVLIRQLLKEPSVESPLNPEAAQLYSNDKAEYEKRVKALF